MRDMTSEAGEVRWLSAPERAAWLAVAGLMVELPSALDTQLQSDAGLSFFEYMVLAVLAEQPDHSLQMSEIARLASASLSRLSHTATRLEREGFLRREKVPGAGRRMRAILTDAGYDKVRQSAPGHVAHVRRLLIDAVSADDLAAVTRVGRCVLEKINGGPFDQADVRHPE